MTRQIQNMLFFFILALLSYALYKYYFDPLIITKDKPFTKGYSVENVELKITDEKGQLSAKFKSPNLVRYTDSPLLFIETPLFWTYNDNQEHWLIQSEKAEFNTDTNEVSLIDNVIAKTINDSSETRFKTASLLVKLEDSSAFTDAGISLQQKQFKMSGQIAHFDLKNEILEVNNNVKAIYKPIL